MYTTSKPMQHKRPTRVLEYDNNGLLVGEYKGYYNANNDLVTLYPAYNPFVLRCTPLRKHTVNIREVQIR